MVLKDKSVVMLYNVEGEVDGEDAKATAEQEPGSHDKSNIEKHVGCSCGRLLGGVVMR